MNTDNYVEASENLKVKAKEVFQSGSESEKKIVLQFFTIEELN